MKIPGHCAVSGNQAFEILEYWPPDHPFAGQPRRLGKPYVSALRVWLVLTDGSQMPITVLDEYLDQVSTRLPAIWHDIKARVSAERKAHRALGQKDFSPAQHSFMDLHNLKHNDTAPLGVLCWERWSDYSHGK